MHFSVLIFVPLAVCTHCIIGSIRIDPREHVSVDVDPKVNVNERNDIKPVVKVNDPQTNVNSDSSGHSAEVNQKNSEHIAGYYLPNGDTGVPPKSTIIVTTSGKSKKTETMIRFAGNQAGTFTCSGNNASVTYLDAKKKTYIASRSVPGTECTITVTKYGNVGESIAGTITADVDLYVNGNPGGKIKTISGSFSVIREESR